jgi:hypothetical protein
VSRFLRAPPFFLLLVMLLTIAKSTRAQDAPQIRPGTFVVDDKQIVRLTIGYRDVVDAATVAKLTGGLPTTIVMQAGLFRTTGGDALAITQKKCRVTFDLWEEVYRIEIEQVGSPDTVAATTTMEGVLRRCAEADRLPLIARSFLSSTGRYYVVGKVEVNPVSQEMYERIKRWVSRPAGASTAAPGDALFGSFVGLFVARIGTADRQIAFRTQPFSI